MTRRRPLLRIAPLKLFYLSFFGGQRKTGGTQHGWCLPSLTFPSTLDIRNPSCALLLASTLQLLVQPPPIAEAQVITQYLVPYPSAQAQTSKRLRRWLSTCGDEPGAAQTCALGRSSHSFPSPLSWHPGTLGMLRNKTNLHNHIFSCWKMKKKPKFLLSTRFYFPVSWESKNSNPLLFLQAHNESCHQWCFQGSS